MNSVIDSWREQVQAFDRDMAALREMGNRDDHGQGRPGGFGYANRPMDPHRTDDAALNSLFGVLGAGREVLDVGGAGSRCRWPRGRSA